MFTVIDNNFLSEEDCKDIIIKLEQNKSLWSESNARSFYYFPLGLYACSREDYRNNLPTYKNLCSELFGNYYTKLKNILEHSLGIHITYHENLNYPGFHISKNSMIRPNFHKDCFTNLYEFFDTNEQVYFVNPKIISIIVVVKTLKENTGLLLRKPENSYKFLRNDNYFDLEITYTKGMLAMWDGETTHSIKPYIHCDSNDIRITMQCHVAIGNKKGYIFW